MSESKSKERGRFSSKRKMGAVLRLLRGETIDAVSRDLKVKASTLGQWKERFLAQGQEGLKTRRRDERDGEIQRLRAKIGELTMDNELLFERCRRMEDAHPLRRRRQSK